MAATAQNIYEKALKLPEPLAKEILDFIGYIEMKHGQATQQYVSDFKDVMDLKVLNPFGKHICHGAPQKYI
jgi:hypothetical protein